MATTSYMAANTRPHYAGANADVDIHLEAYEGEVEGSFRVESMFRAMGLTTYKSVQNESNTWRGDRIGGAVVKGRKSGETLDAQRAINDKFVITVDALSYVRHTLDFQDMWTAPDRRNELALEAGSAHAKAFDQAHLIQLIKAGDWVAPADLKASGAFNDGIKLTITGWAAATDPEAKAELLVQKHKAAVTTFVKRDLGGSMAEFVTLLDPDTFSALADHKKLMNIDYDRNGENSYTMRRVAYLNGVRVVETPRFPAAAISNHHLGPAFNVSAAEAKAIGILFNPRKTLVTVEAHPMTSDQWDDKKEFAKILDSYTLYNVGIRRGDATAVFYSD